MFGETVTVRTRTPGADDRYGNPTYTWADAAVDGCAVAPRSSAEPAQVGRSAVITGLTVYLPTGTEIGPHDRLVIRGTEYEIEGEPGDWRNPYSGRRPGIEVAVRRVEG